MKGDMNETMYNQAIIPTEPCDEYPIPVVELLALDDDCSCWATKTIDVGDTWEILETLLAQTRAIAAYGYTISNDMSTWTMEKENIIVPIYKKEN